eukprot:1146512-Pelagomonas_calceolata.AAC.2
MTVERMQADGSPVYFQHPALQSAMMFSGLGKERKEKSSQVQLRASRKGSPTIKLARASPKMPSLD